MDRIVLAAFQDELSKEAGIGELWNKILNLSPLGRLFSKKEKEKTKAELWSDYHFSAKSGGDRWDKFEKNVRDPKYVASIISHPLADEKLIQHTKSMHELSRGSTVGKVLSFRLPGKSYEIREVSGGLACTCPDWKFKGSINPGYECKHVRAHLSGEARA